MSTCCCKLTDVSADCPASGEKTKGFRTPDPPALSKRIRQPVWLQRCEGCVDLRRVVAADLAVADQHHRHALRAQLGVPPGGEFGLLDIQVGKGDALLRQVFTGLPAVATPGGAQENDRQTGLGLQRTVVALDMAGLASRMDLDDQQTHCHCECAKQRCRYQVLDHGVHRVLMSG